MYKVLTSRRYLFVLFMELMKPKIVIGVFQSIVLLSKTSNDHVKINTLTLIEKILSELNPSMYILVLKTKTKQMKKKKCSCFS